MEARRIFRLWGRFDDGGINFFTDTRFEDKVKNSIDSIILSYMVYVKLIKKDTIECQHF